MRYPKVSADLQTFQNKARPRSRIGQAKRLAQIETGVQIEWNGISLRVLIQSEPVRTVRTNVQLAGRSKGTLLYRILF